jgi:hypothetical protein
MREPEVKATEPFIRKQEADRWIEGRRSQLRYHQSDTLRQLASAYEHGFLPCQDYFTARSEAISLFDRLRNQAQDKYQEAVSQPVQPTQSA